MEDYRVVPVSTSAGWTRAISMALPKEIMDLACGIIRMYGRDNWPAYEWYTLDSVWDLNMLVEHGKPVAYVCSGLELYRIYPNFD